MNANFTRNAVFATLLAAALLSGCAGIELSAEGNGASLAAAQDDVEQRMAVDSGRG